MALGTRISVIGNSGSGKTWTASRIAERLGLHHVELDGWRHLPGWTERPDAEFRSVVTEIAAGDGWVIDGNYTALVRDVVWARATAVVWLDPPRRTVMRQVVARSFVRAARRTELWNGNRERWRFWLDRTHPIRWAWDNHARKRVRDAAMLDDPMWSHLTVVRLRSPREAAAWIDALPAGP